MLRGEAAQIGAQQLVDEAALRLIDKVGIDQVVADLRARGEL